MKNLFYLSTFICLLLTGCSSSSTPTSNEITSVSVSEFQQFGKINQAPFMTLNNPDEIAVFGEAIETATKMDGIVNVVKADFDIELLRDNEEDFSFHLWLDDEAKTGSIMYTGDTHTLYSLTEDSTQKLQEQLFQ
ncbi:hypothetical protein [Halalkalibacterium halodurans]|uniref:YhfM-like domain-containing protein n=1 Tax=Halalkalibacterium halodurans TaxID=86665 RepID=A0A0M0KCV7_ALKHA|nr:hypothetical protein [Halalkalibacterium halodurans]MED4122947.1 hypothetical protein [Halalkalibacterium halodurans]TPE70065.1 hypothetical protein AMD02_005410 [Halalkalibacterium halodurans]